MPWGRFIAWVVAFFGLLNGAFALALPGPGASSSVERRGRPSRWPRAGLAQRPVLLVPRPSRPVGYGHVYPASNGAGLSVEPGGRWWACSPLPWPRACSAAGFRGPRRASGSSRTAIISRRADGTPCLQFRHGQPAPQHPHRPGGPGAAQNRGRGHPSTCSYQACWAWSADAVSFFPLSWTLVHDIAPESSPLHGLGPGRLRRAGRGSHHPCSRATTTPLPTTGAPATSCTHDEIAWHRPLPARAYEVGENGIASRRPGRRLHRTEPLEQSMSYERQVLHYHCSQQAV
ncbi:MAG: hypothetical protein WKG07_30640 [Hymenobacter sp.]